MVAGSNFLVHFFLSYAKFPLLNFKYITFYSPNKVSAVYHS